MLAHSRDSSGDDSWCLPTICSKESSVDDSTAGLSVNVVLQGGIDNETLYRETGMAFLKCDVSGNAPN
jgi:hypothetical protein